MDSFFGDFKKFMMRGNVIDLAIGVVIGTAFNNVVTSLVTNIITPPIGLLLGKINFSDLAIPLGGTVKISYGLFVQAIISFIITALALFLLIRFIARVQAVSLRKQQEDSAAPPATADSPELSVLKEIRDSLRPNQTAPLPNEEDVINS
jgi:large conductance mechanosensitive channel